jgi:catechol 2,3-dioxygenase-like lactoylglutathione lyase family enzyme
MKRGLFALVFLATLASAATGTATAAAPCSGVRDIAVTVSDLARSEAFYSDVLGFRKLDEREDAGPAEERLDGIFGVRVRRARMALGDETLVLTEFLVPKGRDVPADSRANDRWFQHIAIVVSNMDEAYAKLRARGVRYASTEPQRLPDWNTNAAGIRAFYFRDPDAHFLELIQFPPGKGQPKWQNAGGRLFLGIDHTAIVVNDTAASLAFYRDVLGLRVVGASENYGTEQEHLNNVFGAHLRITSLRGSSGPGIEFLEYLTPQDGRAAPPDERADDLAWWQTTLACPDAEAIATRAPAGITRVSTPAEPSAPSGAAPAFVLRDRDGHALELVMP